MVDRPLEDRRPVGPIMDIDLDRDIGDKVQLGVSGTSMPGRSKSPLNVLFVMDKHVATLPRDITSSTLRDKIQDKFDGTPSLKAERSGPTSSKPFEEQAIVVELRSDSLPVQEGQINRAANAVDSHYSDFGAGVKNIIFDTE